MNTITGVRTKTRWKSAVENPDELRMRIDRSRIPRHVGIIMDGNGRWARRQGYPRSAGHEAGARTVERLMEPVMDLGVKAISLYSFSKENWERPAGEVAMLWKLLIRFFHRKIDKMMSHGIRIVHSGDLDELPKPVRRSIRRAIHATRNNDKLVLNFCVNYGGRQEIIVAVRKWLRSRPSTENPQALAESFASQDLENYLFTHSLPELDLVIRTSGEMRISNFLLWQIAYSELWVTDTLWPEFSEIDLYQAILDFQSRKRRFGGL